jgi:hypothetical protein
MSSDQIEFVEDKTYLQPLPEEHIPEKSIEGWFYKKFPGSIALKRFILTMIVIVLFAISAILFLLSRSNTLDIFRAFG